MRRLARLILAACLVPAAVGRAQSAPASQPGGYLQQFDRESRALYESVHAAVVRAEVPVLRDPPDPDELLRKWNHKLDPAFRQRLEQELRSRAAARSTTVNQGGTDRAAEWVLVGSCLVIDADGRILVPAYVDRATLGDRKVRVFAADGAVRVATLVGADRPTSLSVLKLEQRPDRHVRFAAARPVPGQLLMVISADDTRWVAWSGVTPASGVVVGCDGQIAGFARSGRLVGGRAYGAVVEQLSSRVAVERPGIGAHLVEMHEEPAGRSVLKVSQVVPGSPADTAGLRPQDVLRTLGGAAVPDLSSLAAELAGQRGAVPLVVAREGEEVTLTVKLDAPTPNPGDADAPR